MCWTAREEDGMTEVFLNVLAHQLTVDELYEKRRHSWNDEATPPG